MKKISLLGYLIVVGLLALAWTGLSGSTSEAVTFMGITDTPTEPPTDTPTPTASATPTSTSPPSGPPTTSEAVTPVGTFALPISGQANPTPGWLLLAVVGGLLVLGTWLLRRSGRLL